MQIETIALEKPTFRGGIYASIDTGWSRPLFLPTWCMLTFEIVRTRVAVVVESFKKNLTV